MCRGTEWQSAKQRYMDMNELISIIVPVHNNKKYLGECLDSIRNQTYRPLECVLVDDGSDESYTDYYDSCSDDIVSVHHIKKSGVSGARNYGLEKSEGDYICFVDSDDVVAPDYCRKLYDLMHTYGTDISACSYMRFGDRIPEIKSGGGIDKSSQKALNAGGIF